MSSQNKDQQTAPTRLQKELRPVHAAKPDDLDRLALSCQDDDWLFALIQDTEQHHLLTAPARIRTKTLEMSQRQLRSKRIQLMIYSMRVSLAAAGAIVVLFTMPLFIEQSWSKTTPPSPGNFTSGSPFKEPSYFLSPREGSQKTFIGIQSISESISELSNELFGR